MNCTRSLISSRVFLTAAYCGRHGTRRSVSFDEVFDADSSPRYDGTFYTHPDYDPAHEFKNDVAVIVLDSAVPDIDASRLPDFPTRGYTTG